MSCSTVNVISLLIQASKKVDPRNETIRLCKKFRMSKRLQKSIIDPKQQSISGLFAKAKQEPVAVVSPVTELTTSKLLVSDDPLVQQYYDSLGEKEQRAHSIAIEKLGTSYDIVRTHGFLTWQKTRK